MTTLVLRTTCAFCGYHHDRITAIEDDNEGPVDGDASMCWACGAFNIVDNNTDEGLRKPSRSERGTLDADNRIGDLREAWLLWKARQ